MSPRDLASEWEEAEELAEASQNYRKNKGKEKTSDKKKKKNSLEDLESLVKSGDIEIAGEDGERKEEHVREQNVRVIAPGDMDQPEVTNKKSERLPKKKIISVQEEKPKILKEAEKKYEKPSDEDLVAYYGDLLEGDLMKIYPEKGKSYPPDVWNDVKGRSNKFGIRWLTKPKDPGNVQGGTIRDFERGRRMIQEIHNFLHDPNFLEPESWTKENSSIMNSRINLDLLREARNRLVGKSRKEEDAVDDKEITGYLGNDFVRDLREFYGSLGDTNEIESRFEKYHIGIIRRPDSSKDETTGLLIADKVEEFLNSRDETKFPDGWSLVLEKLQEMGVSMDRLMEVKAQREEQRQTRVSDLLTSLSRINLTDPSRNEIIERLEADFVPIKRVLGDLERVTSGKTDAIMMQLEAVMRLRQMSEVEKIKYPQMTRISGVYARLLGLK